MKEKLLAVVLSPTSIGLPANVTSLGGLLSLLIPAVISLAGIATFILILFGGFRYLTAGGDEKAIGEAVKIITNAVIGLTIVFGSWWAIRIIETIFGINVVK